jgi:hypothetical protein
VADTSGGGDPGNAVSSLKASKDLVVLVLVIRDPRMQFD